MRKRLVVHPGMPKTGSSAIQRFCWENRVRLAEAGIHYPDQLKIRDPRHQFLLQSLKKGAFDSLARWLRATPDGHTLLLSTEGICNQLLQFSHDQPELRALLRDVEVDIVVYHRDPKPWAVSYYKQIVANGQTTFLYDTFQERVTMRFLMDRTAVNARLTKLFGGRIIEIEYEPGTVLPAFRAALGLTDEDWVEPAARVNSSIPDAHTEIARQALKIDRGFAQTVLAILSDHSPTGNLQMQSYQPSWLPGYDQFLEAIEFRENPPLRYTREEFAAALGKIRRGAASIKA